MSLINFKWRTKGKKKCQYLEGKKNWDVCVFLCAVKVNSNHGIRS